MSEKVNSGQKGGKGKVIPLFSGHIEAPPYKLQKPPVPAYGQDKQQPPYGQDKQQPPSGPSQGSNSNLLVDLQVFKDQPPKKTSTIPEKAKVPFLPVITPSSYLPNQVVKQMQELANPAPLFYTDHHIHIGGPDADHIQATMIYEDAMPPENVFKSYKTLKERNNLSDYIRGTFIQDYDGEDITFNGKANSLNSRLKFLEINPFNSNSYNNNPYLGLPHNLLIYSSCYPIEYNKSLVSTQCKKNSVGINIRLYALSLVEAFFVDFKSENFNNEPRYNPYCTSVNYNTLLTNLSCLDSILAKNLLDAVLNKDRTEYNVWREIYYYSFIRNVINKKNISPNFLKAYCLFVYRDSSIQFPNFNQRAIIHSGASPCDLIRSNKVLVVLTESPNYSIFTWSSNVYETDRNIQKQIYSGFKTDNRWKSVIAQIVTAFYVMDKYEFTFNEMALEKNFYIKDVPTSIDTTQYWKYTINGVDYFIPNYGDLLLVDTDYHDLNDNTQYKIISKFLIECDTAISQAKGLPQCTADIKTKVKENAVRCLSSNNFGQAFTAIGGVLPSSEILDLLNKISTDINRGISYEEIMKTYFTSYVHNRVGTLLRESEVNYVKKIGSKSFRTGELVVYESEYEKYEIVIYLEDNGEYECKCIRRGDNGKLVTDDNVGKDMLFQYSSNETIYQDVSAGQSAVNASYIIETYTP
jgi:hypothetical protein